jgi:hypothetical protein
MEAAGKLRLGFSMSDPAINMLWTAALVQPLVRCTPSADHRQRKRQNQGKQEAIHQRAARTLMQYGQVVK